MTSHMAFLDLSLTLRGEVVADVVGVFSTCSSDGVRTGLLIGEVTLKEDVFFLAGPVISLLGLFNLPVIAVALWEKEVREFLILD